MIKKVNNTKITPVMPFKDETNTASLIYEFCGKTAQLAEYEFNLSSDEGDLVYNSVLTALLYLKDYPKD